MNTPLPSNAPSPPQRRPRRNARRALCARMVLFALLTTSLGGCGLLGRLPEPTPREQDIAVAWHADATARPRRVAVLPLHDETGHGEKVAYVTDALREALERKGAFEVIAGTLDEPTLVSLPRETGRIPRRALVELARRYGVDAVLFGTLSQYRAYEPVAVGLEVSLVSTDSGTVLWTASGLFDAADARVVKDVHHYHDTQLPKDESLEGWRRLLVSPQRFTRYACTRLAATY